MRWLSRLVTIGIAVVLAAGALILIVRVATPKQSGGRYVTSALFRDASNLPVGSRVVIAGVNVGRITHLAVEGNQARVTMRLRDDTVLWDDAWATKKAESALGDNYVEISPGGVDPDDPDDHRERRRLKSGEPIPRTVESATVDRVFRGIEHALPRLDDNMAAANALIDEGREWVAGPFVARLNQLDARLARGDAARGLDDINQGMGRFEDWTARAEAAVHDYGPEVQRRLDTLPADIAGVTADLHQANGDLAEAMAGARTRMDDLDPAVQRAADLVDELNGGGERQGTLARLINDPELGDDLAEGAEGVAELTDSFDRLKTTIGFRFEQNILSVEPRFYVSAELRARPDQFYLIELEKGPTGDVPEVQLTEVPGSPELIRTAVVRERLRITAQWGKRLGAVSLRLGLKESAFGAGVDTVLLGGRLKLSADAMESSFDHVPRIKLAAALAAFRSIYVLGGVDDALTRSGKLSIRTGNDDVPIQFEQLRYGRDYYLGLELRFTDADVNRLLMIYGGVLAAALF